MFLHKMLEADLTITLKCRD